jgi:ketosteroid isomerase-like protein
LKVLAFLLLASLAVQSFAEESINTLVQSEISFAKTASEKGIKTAFLAYLAEDSLLFRPAAVAGKKWITEHPETPGVLNWEPTYAEVSGAGDLGFTTGPYIYKESKDSTEGDYGQFFSIWKKQSGGKWKVYLDTGLPKKKEKTPLITRTNKGSVSSKEEADRELKVVAKADLNSSETTGALLLHNQEYEKNCTFAQNGSGISQSADLAYFYGTFQCGAAQGSYVRVWRKLGRWQLAIEYLK